MLSRLKGLFQSLRKSPFLCDLGIALAVIPAFTYLAYSTSSRPSPLTSWHFDRLMKRDAYIANRRLPKRDVASIRAEYSRDSGMLSQPNQAELKLGQCFFRLNAVNNELINDPKLREEVVSSKFMEDMLSLLQLRPKIVDMNSKRSLYEFCVFEESALNLLLSLSLSSSPTFRQYKTKIEEVMKEVRKFDAPYTLKNALVDSYFFNKQQPPTGILYNGRVICMNPERMGKYDTDVLFIHGQQSHCFTSWRVFDSKDRPLKLFSGRSYLLSTLWPPLFLADKHNSRLLSLNYTVLCCNTRRPRKADWATPLWAKEMTLLAKLPLSSLSIFTQ
eukprot:TRINITY_DN9129_c0_g1_i2.p1 TRINITY_DN9129_c0_g1~~TRINITY_DN9129_c0_g1_i2.p1  ORF type:complete len:331 (-),score=27.85 TRINITY_DN9129_c0_g1_i2:323-1315(-)